jgi:predicted nucleic acid-binding protein
LTHFLDTSVLVAAFLTEHNHHAASRSALRQCGPETAACAGHTLAEFYATMTRLPAPHSASPDQTLLFMENIEQHLAIVSFTSEEYRAAIRSAAAAGIAGGTFYDYLIARCALKAEAEIICTWNIKHYQLFGTEVAARLRMPDSNP